MAGEAGFLVGAAVGAGVGVRIVTGDAGKSVVALFETGTQLQAVGLEARSGVGFQRA